MYACNIESVLLNIHIITWKSEETEPPQSLAKTGLFLSSSSVDIWNRNPDCYALLGLGLIK